MGPSLSDRADFLYLMRNAEVARRLDVPSMLHIDQAPGLWNYIRIANDVTRHLAHGTILDWGCGYGQMTYLLQRRGLEVTPCDYAAEGNGTLPDMPLCHGLRPTLSRHPVLLPFPDGHFDAVLSCGVLEHVQESSTRGSAAGSLQELRRILKPTGLLFIYQLPQVSSWQENLQGMLRLGYHHPVKYTKQTIQGLLHDTGFSIERVARANFLPKNLTGMPKQARNAFGRLGRAVVLTDGVLSAIPGLNYFAGSLEIVARASHDGNG